MMRWELGVGRVSLVLTISCSGGKGDFDLVLQSTGVLVSF